MGNLPPILSYEPGAHGSHPEALTYRANDIERSCAARLPSSGAEVTVLRDREAVVTALTDPRFGLADVHHDFAATGAVFQAPDGMLRLDPPKITAIRRAIGHIFSAKAVERYTPALETAADTLINKIVGLSGPTDLQLEYCEPFIADASHIAAGIPRERWPELLNLSNATLSLVEGPEDAAEMPGNWERLYACCDALITSKREQPDGSILSNVTATLDRAGILTEEEQLRASTTIINGFPTPLPTLNVAIVELLRRPDIVRACQKDPELWDAAVREVLRHKAHFAFALPRVAMADVQLGEETIPKGRVVLPSLTAAAHDPKRVPNPGEFDISQNAARGIIFGAGPHFCIGAALGRQWLRVGLEQLFTRLPNLRLAVPLGELRWEKGTLPTAETIPVLYD